MTQLKNTATAYKNARQYKEKQYSDLLCSFLLFRVSWSSSSRFSSSISLCICTMLYWREKKHINTNQPFVHEAYKNTTPFGLTCKCCWENWEQCCAVRGPRKIGGRGATMAGSGPGCNSLWVTLRSMGSFLPKGNATWLLRITSTTEEAREKHNASLLITILL